MNESEPKLLEFLCQHMVALCVTYWHCNEAGPIGEPLFFVCPGTIIYIRGVSAFLTAGHTLKDWTEALHQHKVRVISAVLADTFGLERVTNQPIPFDFINEPRIYIDEEAEGLDFGLIYLRPYYVQLLKSNGIKLIFEENWIHQHAVKFDAYFMLGLPDELMQPPKIDISHGKLLAEVSPTLIPLTRLDHAPAGSETRRPRFVGKLNPNLQIDSILGMSGGPILGFRFGPPMEYWVVAIQSSWIRKDRITFGCPIPVLAELIAAEFDRLEEK